MKKVFALTTLFFSITSTSFANDTLQQKFYFAGIGSYARWSEQPLFISHGAAKGWRVNYIKMPYSKNTDLLAAGCTENSCAMVGFYEPYPNTLLQKPIIISNIDGHWVFIKKIANLPNINFGMFTSIDCQTKQCLIAGLGDNVNNMHPILLVAGDGNHWYTIKNITPPNDIKNSNLFDLKCKDTQCYAVGNYFTFTANEPAPLLLTSADSGKSWQTASITLSNAASATLSSIACSNEQCYAAGSYFNANNDSLPIIISKREDGTWSAHPDVLLPASLKKGEISKIKCQSNICVALGSYADNDVTVKPLILASRDGGMHWIAAEDMTKINQSVYIVLKDAACQDNRCTVVGSYNDKNNKQHPLILDLAMINNNWHFTVNAAHVFKMEDQLLNKITCKQNECVTIGDTAQYPAYAAPLILSSIDHGKTWERVKDINNYYQAVYTRFKTFI